MASDSFGQALQGHVIHLAGAEEWQTIDLVDLARHRQFRDAQLSGLGGEQVAGKLAVGTMGAKGFKPAWLPYFDGLKVFIAFDGDAAGSFVRALCVALVRMGHTCEVLAPSDPDARVLRDQEITIHRVPSRAPGDVSGYIPTNVISITDGQMFLIADLFNKGIRPAIDVGISVSRVGGDAQTKAMKKVAGGLKLELAQFRELEAFMQFASDLDKATADRIASGQRMVEVLKQKNGHPIAFERQVAMIFAANKGMLNSAPVNKVVEIERLFVDFLDGQYSSVLNDIKTTGVLSDESMASILKAAEEFKLAHPELFTL
jgi:hypothetical protein